MYIDFLKSNIWKAISLFSGAGGCSLGFFQAGVNILAAYDNAESVVATYNKNFIGERCHKVNLADCNFEEIRENMNLKKGELDIIIGGPPCQGFTTAGNRFWDDPRNKLIQNYAQALETFSPRWFMMENVEGILTTAKGEYIYNFIKKMSAQGYSIFLKKVYMQEYGIPQRRKRVIIVGNREGKEFSFPKPIVYAEGSLFRKGSVTLRDVIGDLEKIEIPEIDHIWRKLSGIQQSRINALQPGQSMKDLPEYLQHNSFKSRASRRVCDGTPLEKRGGAPAGLKRLLYDEPSLTITSASTMEFIHPVMNRPLTVRECARIQTFPDDFSFMGTEAQKILQIGNAIPPQFAKQLARQIILCDNNSSHCANVGLNYFDVTKANAKSPALNETCRMLNGLKANS